jgi:hypothetical protein
MQIAINAHALNCAVLAGREDKATRTFDLARGVFHGTAFCIAPNLFLTAGHVFRAARSDGAEVCVARLTPGNFHGITVHDFELFDAPDLALLYCPGLAADIVPINFTTLPFLADVFSAGFAFGFDPPKFHVRAFKGYVVNRRELDGSPVSPPAYELSFIPPPGLSGAPLLTSTADGTVHVCGIILGQHTTEFMERRMDLGIALDIEEILTLDSRIIGGSIAECIFRRPKIHRNDIAE